MLKKVQDDSIVQGLSKKKQNLLHYLAKTTVRICIIMTIIMTFIWV